MVLQVVQLLIPNFLVQMVYEKEQRLRMMMRFHGLSNVAYWWVTGGEQLLEVPDIKCGKTECGECKPEWRVSRPPAVAVPFLRSQTFAVSAAQLYAQPLAD
jgi:hypothetical protein